MHCNANILQYQVALKKRKPLKMKNPLSPATTLSTTSLIKNNNDLVVRGSVSETHNNVGYTDEIDVCGVDDDENRRNDVACSGYALPKSGAAISVPNVQRSVDEQEDDASDSEDINTLEFIKSIVSYEDKEQNIPTSLSLSPARHDLILNPASKSTAESEQVLSHSSSLAASHVPSRPEGSCRGEGTANAMTNGQSVVSSKSLPSVLAESFTKPAGLPVRGVEGTSKNEDGFSVGSNENGNNEEEDDDPILGLELIKEKIERSEFLSVVCDRLVTFESLLF